MKGRWPLCSQSCLKGVEAGLDALVGGARPVSPSRLPRRGLPVRLGTHNLHDETGTPTAFADLILFTEAIPLNVRRVLIDRGYKVIVCEEQRDLVIAYRPGYFTPRRFKPTRYELVHGGIAEVTPHRGTFSLVGRLHDGRRAAVVVEHRINAAFPPYVRGEAGVRQAFWTRHTNTTLRIVQHHLRLGRVVLAGGDLNTPEGVSGYRGVLHEVGDHFDRLGASVPLHDVEVLTRKGSDHNRLVVTV